MIELLYNKHSIKLCKKLALDLQVVNHYYHLGFTIMNAYRENITMEDYNLKVRCFTSSSNQNNSNSITVHPHWHDEVEILYVLKGSASQQVNDNIFNINRGDMVIIRSQDIHSTYTLITEMTEILVVQFVTSILDSGETGISSVIDTFSRNTEIPCPVKTEIQPGSELADIVIRLQNEYCNKRTARELVILSDCALLIALVTRYYTVETIDKSCPINVKKSLEKIFNLIDENFSRHISLKEAAFTASFSIPHFCRLFKQAMGMSFINYLNHYRIKKSLNLMRCDWTITEIAHSCGFGSINSFIRTFKKYYKISPEKFRKQQI